MSKAGGKNLVEVDSEVKARAARLCEIMEAYGISQEKLAKEASLTQGAISNAKRGDTKKISMAIWNALSRLTGLSLNQILQGTVESPVFRLEARLFSFLRNLSREMGEAAYEIALRDAEKTARDWAARDGSAELVPADGLAEPGVVDRRDEIATYSIAKTGRRSAKLPLWYNLACAPGSELERTEDYLYFRELPDWAGRHSAKIRGDSMEKTLLKDDIIVVEEIAGPGGLTLGQVTDADQRMSLIRFEQFVRHDNICIVSINDEPPTLKRIKIRKRMGSTRWTISVVADNHHSEWMDPMPIEKSDSIRFYAKLIGRAKREGE